MPTDRFGFIGDVCRFQEEQDDVASRRSLGDSSSQELAVDGDRDDVACGTEQYHFTLTDSTGIMMMSLPDTGEGLQEEEEEEYHTPPENSSAVPSSDEAVDKVGRVVDLGRDDEVDTLRLEKGGATEGIPALSENGGLQGSSINELREALYRYSDGGNVPDLEGLDHGPALKGKAALARQEYRTRKLSKRGKKFGSVIGDECNDTSDSGVRVVVPETLEIGISVKDRDENVSGGELDGRLKRKAADGEFGGSLACTPGTRFESLGSGGNRDTIKDVGNGSMEADDEVKESPAQKMKNLVVNLQVQTPSSSVGIIKEKVREFQKSMEKLNLQEGGIEGGSSLRGKSSKKKSDCRDTIRIVSSEVLERSDGPVVDLDVDNTTAGRETPAGNKRRNNLAQDKSVDGKRIYLEKRFRPHDEGKRICLDGGSGMIDLDVDDFETCDKLAQALSRECVGPSHIGVLGESSKVARGLRKLPPSIAGQPTNEESRRQRSDRSQATVPPVKVAPPEDEAVHLASSKLNAPPPPNVMLPNLLKVTKLIAGTCADTNEEAGSLLDVAKRHGMNIPWPRWWPEEF